MFTKSVKILYSECKETLHSPNIAILVPVSLKNPRNSAKIRKNIAFWLNFYCTYKIFIYLCSNKLASL